MLTQNANKEMQNKETSCLNNPLINLVDYRRIVSVATIRKQRKHSRRSFGSSAIVINDTKLRLKSAGFGSVDYESLYRFLIQLGEIFRLHHGRHMIQRKLEAELL